MTSRQAHLHLLRELLYQMLTEAADNDDHELMQARLSKMMDTLKYLIEKM